MAAQLQIKKLNTTDDFLTPPALVAAMGEFDLDPCASHRQMVPLARACYRYPETDGLLLPWVGSVLLNPPFSELPKWVNRFTLHGNGVLLAPARVEVEWFWRLWSYCDAIFLTRGAVKYLCLPGKSPPRFFGGAFCAIGRENAERLRRLPLRGVLVTEWGRKETCRLQPLTPDEDAADSLASYDAAVQAIGDRVRAGDPVPEFMLSRKKD